MTPGAVAAASLLQAVETGEVNKDDCILLNMSGGGVDRLKKEIETHGWNPGYGSKNNGCRLDSRSTGR